MKSSNCLVSIVTPVYNGEQFIADCIESVLSQSYQNWEHIVLDNCCSDATPDILDRYLKKDSRIRVERNPELLPAISNWNLALTKISSESRYTQVLHADDRLHPDYLLKKVDLAERHPEVGIIGCFSEADGEIWGKGLDVNQEAFSGPEIARQTLLGSIYPFLGPSLLFLRSDIVRGRNPFYADQIHSDVAACYEILREWGFGMVHEQLSYIGVHEGTITNTVASPLNRLLISNLELLLTYGPEYLKPLEMQTRVDERLDNYYRFLSQCVLEGRDQKFWKYHRDAMRELGLPVSNVKLARALLEEFRRRPKNSLSRIKRNILDTGRRWSKSLSNSGAR